MIGSGHAGLNALKEIRKQTDNWVLINGGELETTCARVGCMPSKAIIELASTYRARTDEAHLDREAVVDPMEEVRDYRDIFVDLVLANTTDNMREDEQLIRGYARSVDRDRLEVNGQNHQGTQHHRGDRFTPGAARTLAKTG